jgi:hypothetical protein
MYVRTYVVDISDFKKLK